ncbi:MAG TPA: two-component regulator propeller domain-containing protein [Tenuifilaceae bacterium]|nr:two-component regulator propeller domain-containing protein [Tenuifilaceae bacterium]HPE17108.1 two-component regulator propeller domain-containing protein [Tenuifilaceae bacterium]HPJ44834.1 two-component regulator propeller domain-containing protein [Tenuifilaceae bacterium]HPQ32872.1 two-component regulator propeller domain-containing protein [Tenuifilaceae bacterium]HRX67199.1 two-component regulator propeller domain-containing protein [Tenuifilaceae bacterium]
MRRHPKIFIIAVYLLANSNLSFPQIQKIDIPENQYVFTFQEDYAGNVWLGLSDGNIQGSLCMYSDSGLNVVSGSGNVPNGSYHTSVRLPDGSLLFSGSVLSQNSKSLLVWVSQMGVDTIQIPFRLNDPFVNIITLVNRRDIWIGTGSGLLINSRGEWRWLTKADGLPGNFINTIHEDIRGIVWVGTDAGIVSFFEGNIEYPESGSRLISTATTFFTDSKGYLWCGARFLSQGVSVYNGEIWETFSGRNGLIDNSVSLFYQSPNDEIWIGSCYDRNRGGVSVFNGNEWISYNAPDYLAKPCVDAIVTDSKGRVWLGGSLDHSRFEGITVFDGNNWNKIGNTSDLPAERVIAFFTDTKGNIWISSHEGLYIVDDDFEFDK